MSKSNRRTFLLGLGGVSLVALLPQKAFPNRIRGFRFINPIEGFTYETFNFIVECEITFRRTQNYPRIGRVNYKIGGQIVATGFPDSPRPFYTTWRAPFPPPQGTNYTMTAEAVQNGTETVVATATVNFRLVPVQS